MSCLWTTGVLESTLDARLARIEATLAIIYQRLQGNGHHPEAREVILGLLKESEEGAGY